MIENMNNNRDWLRKMAAKEDNAVISAGGLAAELEERMPPAQHTSIPVFARLIELRRRERRLTIEQLASRADIDVEEILAIESGERSDLEPRTIYQLAKVLDLPAPRLLQLSGMAHTKSNALGEAVIRFAARSKTGEKLTKEEHEALEEFVRFLDSK